MAGAEILRPPVHRITLAQLAILVLLCLVLLASDKVRAWSVFSGGLIAVLPQAYFAALAFRWRGARSAKAIARSAYVGQVGKFLLSLAGFAAVFVACFFPALTGIFRFAVLFCLNGDGDGAGIPAQQGLQSFFQCVQHDVFSLSDL